MPTLRTTFVQEIADPLELIREVPSDSADLCAGGHEQWDSDGVGLDLVNPRPAHCI
jgi:hypothetical protein